MMNLYDFLFEGILKPIRIKHVHIIKKYACKKIIDVGCGTGSQCQFLSNNGYTVSGIDENKKMIDRANNKKIKHTTFICNTITKIQDNKNGYDCAILTLVLHANNQQEITHIISKAKRIVKPKGIIIITDYDTPRNIKGTLAAGIIYIIESFAKHIHRKNYYSFIKKGGLERILKIQNIEITESHQFFNGALITCIIPT